jgi:hypothetical protein
MRTVSLSLRLLCENRWRTDCCLFSRGQTTEANTTLSGEPDSLSLPTLPRASTDVQINLYRWAGADTSDGSQFYYNSNVIKIFKDYITVLLSHTNQYTGVSGAIKALGACVGHGQAHIPVRSLGQDWGRSDYSR